MITFSFSGNLQISNSYDSSKLVFNLIIKEAEELKEKVMAVLHEIYDPEIPVDIYELGLVYEVEVLPINNVQIVMTLTAPSCPSAQELPIEVEDKVRAIEGVNEVSVSVVWDPPWDRSMMSEVAMLELGFM